MPFERVTIGLENLHGAGDLILAEEALERVPGTVSVFVNPETETAFVVCEPGSANLERFLRALAEAGLKPSAL
jgi:copper chaperone CopZ